MTPELLEELRDVRVALEGAVAKRAASRMTREHLDALQDVFDVMDAQVEAGDVSAYLRSNFEFHTAIYAHGASDLTLATIQNLWMRIGPFLNLVAPDIPHMRRSMAAHRHIVEALWRGDGEGARAGIEEDISDAAADLHERLRSATQGSEAKGSEDSNEQALA
jgi:DNA-binding GntR family transcriptional regulator